MLGDPWHTANLKKDYHMTLAVSSVKFKNKDYSQRDLLFLIIILTINKQKYDF